MARRYLTTEREQGFTIVAGLLLTMWLVEIVDQIVGHDLDQYGIRPRNAEGLEGVAASPFLHGGFDHLIGNSVPFAFLGGVIALSGAATVVLVLAIVAVVGGLGTWLIAPENTVHIGASGLVFGMAAYLIARGFLSRSAVHLLTGAIVVLVWGATLLQGLAPADGISWQGHVFGAVGGLVAARVIARRTATEATP